MKPDERSFRIMLVADGYVNPPPGGLDAVAVAAQTGWGVMQLPADDYPPEVAGPLLAEVAEQVEEFSRHGYDFVLIGERAGLAEALATGRRRGPGRDQPADARSAGRVSPRSACPARGPGHRPGRWLTPGAPARAACAPGNAVEPAPCTSGRASG